MKIGLKLTITFITIALLSMLMIGYISYYEGKKSLEQESFNRLTAVREMKARQIEDYFKLISDQIVTFSEDPSTIFSLKRFKTGYKNVPSEMELHDSSFVQAKANILRYFENDFFPQLNKNIDQSKDMTVKFDNDSATILLQDLYISSNPNKIGSKHLLDHPGDSSSYSKTHARYHPVARHYLEKFGYYDIFFVDNKTGKILYSVFKEVDFGTSLIDGPYSNTNLARSFKAAAAMTEKGQSTLVDFESYLPSYNAPAAFISAPVFDKDEMIGVVIFQLPIARINNIMTNNNDWKNVGLGNTGETYIVGEDFTLRNQSRFLIEDSTNYFRLIKEIGVPETTITKIRNFNSTIGLQVVKTQGTEAALKGDTGSTIFNDYRGVPVLSAYRPLNIPGVKWAIMSEIDEDEAFAAVYDLRRYILIGFTVLLTLIVIASYFISRQLTRPLKELTYDAMELAKGNMEVTITSRRKDEIGILSLSFRKMQISISNLIGELRHINQNLEQKVIERTEEIHRQKEMVEEKNKEIVDSINYAQRLQRAIFPPLSKVKEQLEHCFILFKPKDIVSGDFYWMFFAGDEILIAAVDCTGHGVPGAMVSVVGANSLDRCVKEFGLREPAAILDKLTELVQETFETSDHEVKDGMDVALVCLNRKTKKIQYAGANNPLWVIRKNAPDVEEIKADKQPIGKFDYRKKFTNHEVELEKGDSFYLFSDGYADQFGGPGGKKFKYKTMKELLLNVREEPMEAQIAVLNEAFENWKGNLEQIDDVCVIGVRV